MTVCGNGDGARTRVRASEMGGCGDNGEGDGRGRVRCDEPMFFFSIMSLEGAGELSAGGLREIFIFSRSIFLKLSSLEVFGVFALVTLMVLQVLQFLL